MKRVGIDHPAVKEMISRRSGGSAEYVAGVRAYLIEEKEPPPESLAYRGYLDAHDMNAYLSELHADLVADELEEDAKLARYRSEISRCSPEDWEDGENLMPSTRWEFARRAAREARLWRNPESDTRLDRFIAGNPSLREYYEKQSKEGMSPAGGLLHGGVGDV